MASEDKVLKALQKGIDEDAQPAQLLEELLKRCTGGEDMKEACSTVIPSFPDAQAMLNPIQTICTGAPVAVLAHSFSTPAPKTKALPAAPKDGGGGACDETIVDDEGKSRQDAEETVMFGAKLSAAKNASSASKSTPAGMCA